MSPPESDIAQPSASTLSLNDLPIISPRPVMGNRVMSVPDIRKRLPILRLEGKKQRKVSQDIIDNQDATTTPATYSTFSSIKYQATVAIFPQELHSDKPSRKRDSVSQWLSQQAERLERFKKDIRQRGDSLLSPEELEKELKLASRKANTTVRGPRGEAVPQRVIDHFFDLYPACGSDWRDSARWEIHCEECSQLKCNICRDIHEERRQTVKGSPSPSKSPVSGSSRSPSPLETKLPKESKSSKEFHWSNPFRRSRSKKRKQKRGKSLASDELYDSDSSPSNEGPVSPRTQTPKPLSSSYETKPRPPKISIDTYDRAVRHQHKKPVRCSFVAGPFNPSLIPVAAVSDKPVSSLHFDPRNLAQQTGRPYRASTFDLLDFPLAPHYKTHHKTPSAPRIKPERRIAPVPEPLRLDADSRAASDDEFVFPILPLSAAGPSAANIQRSFYPQPRLRDADTVTPDEPYTIAEILAQHDGLEMRKTRNKNRDSTIRLIPSPSLAPAFPVQFPPTPPDSRHASSSSESSQARVSNTYRDRMVLPAGPRPIPEGPADRDRYTCKISDTTGSSLPDCPVYVNPGESRDRKWREWTRERWSGGCKWRYPCSDDDGDDSD